jgi:hypothetical protein
VIDRRAFVAIMGGNVLAAPLAVAAPEMSPRSGGAGFYARAALGPEAGVLFETPLTAERVTLQTPQPGDGCGAPAGGTSEAPGRPACLSC